MKVKNDNFHYIESSAPNDSSPCSIALPSAFARIQKNRETNKWEITVSGSETLIGIKNIIKFPHVITDISSSKEAKEITKRYLVEEFLGTWLSSLGYKLELKTKKEDCSGDHNITGTE